MMTQELFRSHRCSLAVSIGLFSFCFVPISSSGVYYDQPSNYIPHPPFPSFQVLKLPFSFTLTPHKTLHCTNMSKTNSEKVNGDYSILYIFTTITTPTKAQKIPFTHAHCYHKLNLKKFHSTHYFLLHNLKFCNVGVISINYF